MSGRITVTGVGMAKKRGTKLLMRGLARNRKVTVGRHASMRLEGKPSELTRGAGRHLVVLQMRSAAMVISLKDAKTIKEIKQFLDT